MEQVDRLSASELVELRDVIDVKIGNDVPAGQWAILEQRVSYTVRLLANSRRPVADSA
jgi:hypothetical protein